MSGPGSRRVTRVDTKRLDPLALYMCGYDRLIVGASFRADPATGHMLRQEHVVAGQKPGGGVVISPEVRIFRLEAPRADHLSLWLQTPEAVIAPDVRYGTGPAARAADATRCSPERGKGAAGERADGGCWVRTRASRLLLGAGRLGALPAPGGVVTVQAEL